MLSFKNFRTSLQYHDVLNPVLWDGDTLKPDIKEHLLAIAKRWQSFAKIPDELVDDIIVSGGNVNYNYTPESDIDVHLVVDYRKLPSSDPAFVMDYFMNKKDLWAAKHHITVAGYDVELFAQDSEKKTPTNQGVYSLVKGDWVVRPHNLHLTYDDVHLAEKVRSYIRQINRVIRENDLEGADAIKDKLQKMRQAAIAEGGEFAHENLVFKDLRNKGHLGKLKKFITARTDAELSY